MKNRKSVRKLAKMLQHDKFEVFDFTNSDNRKAEEIPPEKFTELFDPMKHAYHTYINKKEWVNPDENSKFKICIEINAKGNNDFSKEDAFIVAKKLIDSIREYDINEIVDLSVKARPIEKQKDYSDDYQREIYSSNGTLNIDLSIGNIFTFTPVENVTKLHISNWTKDIDRQSMTLVLTQPESAYDIDFGDVLWAGGTTPDIKKDLTKYVIIIISQDEGITKQGFISTVL
jgi:hypothetical protein